MRSHKYHPNYTVDEYRTWKGDWELIDGLPSAMMPSPSKQHQLLAYELGFQIGTELKNRENNCGNCRVIYETDWVIDQFMVLRPDIAVICNDTEGEVISKTPFIIIEIISPSSGLKDRHTKFEIYEEQKVPYYIIVDPKSKFFNVYVLKSGFYEEQNKLKNFQLEGCAIQIDVLQIIADSNL